MFIGICNPDVNNIRICNPLKSSLLAWFCQNIPFHIGK